MTIKARLEEINNWLASKGPSREHMQSTDMKYLRNLVEAYRSILVYELRRNYGYTSDVADTWAESELSKIEKEGK